MNRENKAEIMHLCEYIIANATNIKAGFLDFDSPNLEGNWSIGSIIVVLNAKLMQICAETFVDAATSGIDDPDQDMLNIRNNFIAFFDESFKEIYERQQEKELSITN